LAAVGMLLNSGPASAQPGGSDGLSVRVVNTPLPVTGSTTVSGGVAATQSGLWDVGVLGTPPVQDVNNPAHTPIQFRLGSDGTAVFVVDPAKRLTIEFVSALCFTPNPGVASVDFEIGTVVGGNTKVHYFAPKFLFAATTLPFTSRYVSSEVTRIYADAGT